ncbi:MbcA/ParS/Xre antitoxin family protein [Sphingopyxis sp. 22461]|uniref:MbcA/ParS/Xre antitoxin family protein n=1 Tax=Sphingopyxis sp. 22461 TaxID=3453923 RepID=UPI003F8794FC
MDKPPGSPRSGSAAKIDIARFAIANRRRLSGPGLRAFLAIADLWGLTEEQRRLVLGYPARSTYHSWVKKARERRDITLSVDVLMRTSAVLGIYKGLRILFADDDKGVEWLRRPHKARVFGGASPIELIASGTQHALLTVRRFLDAACGGLYMGPLSEERDRPPYEDSEIIFDGADD